MDTIENFLAVAYQETEEAKGDYMDYYEGVREETESDCCQCLTIQETCGCCKEPCGSMIQSENC
jgi:hypothetical protein